MTTIEAAPVDHGNSIAEWHYHSARRCGARQPRQVAALRAGKITLGDLIGDDWHGSDHLRRAWRAGFLGEPLTATTPQPERPATAATPPKPEKPRLVQRGLFG